MSATNANYIYPAIHITYTIENLRLFGAEQVIFSDDDEYAAWSHALINNLYYGIHRHAEEGNLIIRSGSYATITTYVDKEPLEFTNTIAADMEFENEYSYCPISGETRISDTHGVKMTITGTPGNVTVVIAGNSLLFDSCQDFEAWLPLDQISVLPRF